MTLSASPGTFNFVFGKRAFFGYLVVESGAHVTSPSSGQGASLAIEDAIILARYLRDLSDPNEAFAMYQRLRQDRVQKVFDGAKRTNRDKAAGPIGRVLRD